MPSDNVGPFDEKLQLSLYLLSTKECELLLGLLDTAKM
jgi:hypothetical protein